MHPAQVLGSYNFQEEIIGIRIHLPVFLFFTASIPPSSFRLCRPNCFLKFNVVVHWPTVESAEISSSLFTDLTFSPQYSLGVNI